VIKTAHKRKESGKFSSKPGWDDRRSTSFHSRRGLFGAAMRKNSDGRKNQTRHYQGMNEKKRTVGQIVS